jgi:hypothetical protein
VSPADAVTPQPPRAVTWLSDIRSAPALRSPARRSSAAGDDAQRPLAQHPIDTHRAHDGIAEVERWEVAQVPPRGIDAQENGGAEVAGGAGDTPASAAGAVGRGVGERRLHGRSRPA